MTNFCSDNGFLCRDIAGEAHEEECRDIPYSVVTLIKQMALELSHDISKSSRDIKKRSHRMNSVAIKDNYVAIENGKTMQQCACDKVFYVATDISTKDKTKADFMSR